MKLGKSILLLLLFFVGFQSHSQETLKAMFYNLLNFPDQEPANERLVHLEYILDDYRPDLFMVCELNNLSGASGILSMMQQSINPNYAMANFVSNTSDDDIGNLNDLQNLIYYDSSKFILEYQTEIPTIYRDFNRYTLKLNTINQSSNPIYLEVFVCHLKASSGTDNEALRKEMVDSFEAYLNDPTNLFDSNSHVILAGDFNVYTSSEAAFQELIDDNNTVTFVDPANRLGSWSANSTFLDVFSQSTRTTSSLGGASGGFDDRFDFILTSENMLTNMELNYVDNSYQVHGNNNNPNCFNQEINSSNCEGSEFSYDLRNALYLFSDHLPVTLQLQTNQSLSVEDYNITAGISLLNGNWVQNTLSLNVNFDLITSSHLIIYNTLGQKIKTIVITHSENIHEDISELTNGMYYIATDNNSTIPIKFIKTN